MEGIILSIFSALYWITVVLANVGKFGVSAAFAIIYVWSAELFPTMVRNSGMGSSSMMARVGSMLCPYVADIVSTCVTKQPPCTLSSVY